MNLREEYFEKTGVDIDVFLKWLKKHSTDSTNTLDYIEWLEQNLEQPRVRLETIDNIIQQWLKSDNENTTHCADLITKALSQPPTETEKEGL